MTAASEVHRPVRLLSIGYEPISRVSIKKAVRLLVLGKAIVVESVPDKYLRHAGVVGEVLTPYPTVIRLTKYVKLPYNELYSIPPISKRGVMIRDLFKCAYCGKKATTIDHVLPRSRGGGNMWENCVACCFRCNNRKDNKTPEEAGMPLLTKPRMPTRMELRQKSGRV